MSPLRGTPGTPERPLHHSITLPAGLHSQKFWRLLFPALEYWGGGPGKGLGLLIPQRDLCSQDNRPNFYLPHVGVGPACSVSLPLLPVSVWFLFYILSYRTSVQLYFRHFELLFFHLVVILRWLWEVPSALFTYSPILTRS